MGVTTQNGGVKRQSLRVAQIDQPALANAPRLGEGFTALDTLHDDLLREGVALGMVDADSDWARPLTLSPVAVAALQRRQLCWLCREAVGSPRQHEGRELTLCAACAVDLGVPAPTTPQERRWFQRVLSWRPRWWKMAKPPRTALRELLEQPDPPVYVDDARQVD